MELERRIHMHFSKNSFAPWVPDVSFSADISLDCISGLPKCYSASPTGLLPVTSGLAQALMLLTGPL